MTKLKPQVSIAPGYLVINTSTATGGITYDREVLTDAKRREARTVAVKSIKKIDNERIVREIDAAVKDVDHVLRDMCVRLPNVGHYASLAVLAVLEERVADIARRVDRLNAEAIQLGSKHRGNAQVVTAILDLQRPVNCQVVYQTIHGVLGELYEALRVGDVVDAVTPDGVITRRHQLRPIMLRTRNLETIIMGSLRASIVNALTRVKTARLEQIGRVHKGELPRDVGATTDLTALETALARFDDLIHG